MEAQFEAFCTTWFHPVLSRVFHPINTLLNPVYQPWATLVALVFFFGTMLWVCVILKESYVNLERPNNRWYTDLRLWTILSMLPHVFVYYYFR